MENEIREAIRAAVADVARYVREAAVMTVETKYVDLDAASFEDASLMVRTIVKLEGESEVVIPAKKNEFGGLEADVAVFDLHQQNVRTAIEYRAKMLQALVGLLREVGAETTGE